MDSLLAHEVSAYLEKYESGILGLDSTLEGFSTDYSTAIRIKLAEVQGWA